MSALATGFDNKRYAELLATYLPKVPENDTENERLTKILLEFEDKHDLSPEEDALVESITVMVEHYEHHHYPIPSLPPLEALHFLMEERGLKHKDLAPVIGSKSLTSEILNGNREISKAVARKLADHLNVSIEHFL